MKKVFIVIGVVATLVLLGILIKVVFFPVRAVNSGLDMMNGVIEQSLDDDNAIYNYEWFKTQEKSIEALYSKEVRAKKALDDFKTMLPEERENWSREDKTEYDRLNTIVVGLGNQIDDAIALYNARSSMVNRSIFKDNLPSNLSREFFATIKLIEQ